MKRFLNYTLLLIFWTLLHNTIHAQAKLEADVGLGLFEGMSTKLRFGNDFKLGVCQGFAQESIWLSGIEGYYYFSGENKFNAAKTNYLMGGLSSTLFTSGYSRLEKILVYTRIGKSMHLAPTIGVNIDAGVALIFSDDIYGYVVLPFPTLSAHFFIRI